MRRRLLLVMGLCVAAPMTAAANADLAAKLARSYAEMDVAEAAAEACPGLFVDERAMDAEENGLVRAITESFGADKVEAVIASPTLEKMTRAEQRSIVARFSDKDQLLRATAASGGVRFVSPVALPPDADEVEDAPRPGEEPVLSPLGDFW